MCTEFKTALVQFAPFVGDVKRNIEKMSHFIETISQKENGVRLIVFPELAVTGFVLGEQSYSLAEQTKGASYQVLADLAKKHQVYLAYGYIELGEEEKIIYDSFALIDDDGQVCANYRKIHLTELERETYTAGNAISIAQTKLGKLGLMICWDMAFPEVARIQAVAGCTVLLSIAAWEKPYSRSLRQFSTARSIDNSVFNIVVNSIGRSADLEFVGQSSVYDSSGRIIAELNEEESYLVASIDYKKQQKQRDSFYTMLKERRTDVYHLSSDNIDSNQ